MDYFIEYFDLFKQVYSTQNNRQLVIPELWQPLDWDDIHYQEIRKYVKTNYHNDIYNSTFLYIDNLSLFDKLKDINYFTIFIALPNHSRLSLYNNFKEHKLYQDVIDNLVFMGWNPKCSIGSALTDGIYPIKLIDNKIINTNILYNINEFGLLTSEQDCLYICDLNNQNYEYNEGDFWYPTKIYVDTNTYNLIK